MTEKIESFSLQTGAAIVVPVVAMTGIIGRVRSPFPEAAATIHPEDGSIFQAEVTEGGIRLVGIAEGEGQLTLIAGPNSSQKTVYRVFVEDQNDTVRWVFGFGGVITEGVIISPPMDVAVIVNDQRVQLTFSGPGSDKMIDIDWGDGNTETFDPATNGGRAQHDYAANGVYDITCDPQDDPDMTYPMVYLDPITIDHFPDVVVVTVDDPVATMTHDKGDISTVVDWGDGTEPDTAMSDNMSHMYEVNGDYTVTTTIGGFDPITTDITIVNSEVGGVSVPPTDTVCFGPFMVGTLKFWICLAVSQPGWFSVAFDVDDDPEPDIQVSGPVLASALKSATSEQRLAILAKVAELR